jgi:aminoglycoside phosphotransferase family enzyme/predicted kinase
VSAAPPPPLVEALKNPACYDHEVGEIRVVETHISWVFLTGTYAYKVKKPVKLPFLDFSTAERRKHFCDEELRLNRRLAAELYLAVVPIGGTPAAPRVGREPAFEHAVKMRQFRDGARLDHELAAGRVSLAAVLGFADDLARFHAGLPPLTAAAMRPAEIDAALENLRELDSSPGRTEERAALDSVRLFTEREGALIESALTRRWVSGAYRECHGDLHLENLLLYAERIVAFDALEFDPKLRNIDVINETAFLVMDLAAHGRTDFGYRFLNRYLETTGDYEGLAVLRFYLVERALIRAKVRALRAAQTTAHEDGGARAYLKLAAELAAPAQPTLVITHGLSGSGKTHVTDELLGRLPAVRLRSDLERKRLHGLAADARTHSPVDGGLYAAEVTEETYRRLEALAGLALEHGLGTIVDAAFLDAELRSRFRRLAERAGARFRILECAAPIDVLRGRIAARGAAGRDASEASGAVLDHQLQRAEALGEDERGSTVTVYTDKQIDFAAVCRALTR